MNVTRGNPTKMPQATPLGSAGYDNARDDIEKTKKLREGSVVRTPTDPYDIANKAYVDSNDFWKKWGLSFLRRLLGIVWKEELVLSLELQQHTGNLELKI